MVNPPDSADDAICSADRAICSARGCRAPATWALRWLNPRLHTPDRRKTWTACDEHREPLAEFLSARRFLCSVEPVRDGHTLDV